MNKLLIKKEISLFHLLMLLTSKLFIGISLGLMFSDLAFPWSYPLVLGLIIFLPGVAYLFKEERQIEKDLNKKLKKTKKNKTLSSK